MSFFTRWVGTGATAWNRSQPVADNAPMINCCRHLRDQITRDSGPLDLGNERLQRDLVAVAEEFDRVLADPGLAAAIRSGQRPWPDLAPRLLDLMLTAATSALPVDPSLTGLIADTVLRARRGSRAAWRLRAQAHERWGDLGSAITAHQEYLARVDIDKLGIGARVTRLSELRDARQSLAAALIDAHDAGAELPMPGAADLHDLLSRPVRQEALELVLTDFLADLTQLPVTALVQLRDVLHQVTHCLRISQLTPPPLPAETVRTVELLRIGDLRSWLEGRSICLVADLDQLTTGAAAAARLGTRIDGYDLVARCDSGRLDPEVTGSRTDLLVIRHDQPANWSQPVDLRLVLAEEATDWIRSVRQNLVPGAQRGLFDKSLRKPAPAPALIGAHPPPTRLSNAFHLVRLLDHLDVNPTIDLIGFGPGDPFSGSEQDWLVPRITRTDEQLVSLR